MNRPDLDVLASNYKSYHEVVELIAYARGLEQRYQGQPYTLQCKNIDLSKQEILNTVKDEVTLMDQASLDARPEGWLVVRDKPNPKTLEEVIDEAEDRWHQITVPKVNRSEFVERIIRENFDVTPKADQTTTTTTATVSVCKYCGHEEEKWHEWHGEGADYEDQEEGWECKEPACACEVNWGDDPFEERQV